MGRKSVFFVMVQSYDCQGAWHWTAAKSTAVRTLTRRQPRLEEGSPAMLANRTTVRHCDIFAGFQTPFKPSHINDAVS
jgi:hypothetical protein